MRLLDELGSPFRENKALLLDSFKILLPFLNFHLLFLLFRNFLNLGVA